MRISDWSSDVCSSDLPAYDTQFDAFAPDAVKGKPAERQKWAVEQLHLAAKASRRLGLDAHASFSGALAWPYLYPWPQRPAGLVEEALRPEERRVGKEGGRACRSRWSPDH